MSGHLQRVLVPVDDSLCARHAVRFANELAESTGASLTLLHVVQFEAAEVMGLRSQSIEAVRNAVRSRAESVFSDARGRLGEHVQFEEAVELGATVPEILGCAEKHHVDLIIMGSRGLGPVGEVLVGSVSDRVMQRAPCPVTVVA